MTKLTIRKPYDKVSHPGESFVGPGRTQQEFARECDINTIMKRYERDGLLEHVMANEGQYADLGDMQEFHDAMNTVRAAQESFETLPASMREEFNNDPAEFLEFTSSATEGQLREKGLLPPVPDPEEPVPVVSTEPAPVVDSPTTT